MPAARLGDQVLQSAPHCHASIHPPAPVPTPVPHPALPLAIVQGCPTVLIGGSPAARVGDSTAPCTGPPPCVPAGPGLVAQGSPTVLIAGLPAARVGDGSSHPACVAVIPSPTGTVLPPGCPTVFIGSGAAGGGGAALTAAASEGGEEAAPDTVAEGSIRHDPGADTPFKVVVALLMGVVEGAVLGAIVGGVAAGAPTAGAGAPPGVIVGAVIGATVGLTVGVIAAIVIENSGDVDDFRVELFEVDDGQGDLTRRSSSDVEVLLPPPPSIDVGETLELLAQVSGTDASTSYAWSLSGDEEAFDPLPAPAAKKARVTLTGAATGTAQVSCTVTLSTGQQVRRRTVGAQVRVRRRVVLELGVMTWNTHGETADGALRLTEVLTAEQPDLVTLQEVRAQDGGPILVALRAAGYDARHLRAGDDTNEGSGEGYAIAVRRASTWSLLGAPELRDFSNDPALQGYVQRSTLARDLCRALRAPASFAIGSPMPGGAPVEVRGCTLHASRGPSRFLQPSLQFAGSAQPDGFFFIQNSSAYTWLQQADLGLFQGDLNMTAAALARSYRDEWRDADNRPLMPYVFREWRGGTVGLDHVLYVTSASGVRYRGPTSEAPHAGGDHDIVLSTLQWVRGASSRSGEAER